MQNVCMYCARSEALLNIMFPVCEIDGFPLYLFRNQTYRGRAVLAYSKHTEMVADMDAAECAAFFAAAHNAVKALNTVFTPVQINLGMFGDIVRHSHLHLVPKYEGTPQFGSIFLMDPQPGVYLTDAEYGQLAASIRAALNAAP